MYYEDVINHHSILFHELDALDPYQTIVCATTNRPDLVDEAIKTRLYTIEAPEIPIKHLEKVIKTILDASEISTEDKIYIMKVILKEIEKMDKPTIRDARQITVVECIRNGVWSI